MSDQQINESSALESVSSVEQAQPVALPGAQLAAQRQLKGWSIEHAASQLKLAIRQVQAIESDHYAALPGPVVIRGFIRAYAKLLGMDGNRLVALLPIGELSPRESIVPQQTLSAPFSESPLPLGNRSKISPRMVTMGVLVVLFVAVLMAIYRTDLFNDVPQLAWLKSDKQASVSEQTSEAVEVPEQLAVQEQSESEKIESIAANPSSSVTNVTETGRVASDTSVNAVIPTVKTATSSAVAPVHSTMQITDRENISKSKNLLSLTIKEDSWVEIRRGDKSIITSGVLKAGTTEFFDITEPVAMVVGNAVGVDARLRGVELDLLSGTTNNIARLSLK